MKKFMSIIIIMMMIVCSVNAFPVQAAKIIMKGNTSTDAFGVTTLLVNASADINNVKAEDVFWIDQQNVDENGGFTIVLPEFDAEKYILRSNANSHEFSEGKTVYVSQNGNVDVSGEDMKAPTTLESAIKNIDLIKEIILLDAAEYTKSDLPRDVIIKGGSADIQLKLNNEVYLTGNLKLDNLTLTSASTIYANGYLLEITDTVNSTERMTVYGGGKGKEVASTNIKIKGGSYKNIYGGGSSGGTVTGDTNVIVSGNVNSGDVTDDSSANYYASYVFGGGYKSKVLGKTNITFDGEATSAYIVGAGYGEDGTATNTNVYIKGGQVMNIFGGSTNIELPEGTETHITMTGGVAEAIFGGNSSHSLNGNTNVNILGGEITRRLYTGCYNQYVITGTNHVVGTTTLKLDPEVSNKLITGNSSTEGVNIGSRTYKTYTEEIDTIIFLNEGYDVLKGKINNTAEYVVKAGRNGDVNGTQNAGEVIVVPDEGKYGCVNGAEETYFKNESAKLTLGDNTVVFNDLLSAEIKEDGIAANAVVSYEKEGKLIAAVYDMSGIFIECDCVDYNTETDSYDISVECDLEQGKSYIVKLFLWNSLTELVPFMNAYQITVN